MAGNLLDRKTLVVLRDYSVLICNTSGRFGDAFYLEPSKTTHRNSTRARTLEIESERRRVRVLRRAKSFSLLGSAIAIPGGLLSALAAVALFNQLAKGGPAAPHPGALMAVWLVLTLPFFTGLLLRGRGRRLRRDANTASPAEVEHFENVPIQRDSLPGLQ